jgi:toxin ParE1/3/4
VPRILRRTEAEQDVLDLWEYIDARSGTDRANAQIWQIERVLIALSNHPGMGRSREELYPNLRSYPTGRYMIFYLALDDGIELVRVLHGSRDIEGIFENEEADDEA